MYTPCPPRCRVCAAQARAIRRLASVLFPLPAVLVASRLARHGYKVVPITDEDGAA